MCLWLTKHNWSAWSHLKKHFGTKYSFKLHIIIQYCILLIVKNWQVQYFQLVQCCWNYFASFERMNSRNSMEMWRRFHLIRECQRAITSRSLWKMNSLHPTRLQTSIMPSPSSQFWDLFVRFVFPYLCPSWGSWATSSPFMSYLSTARRNSKSSSSCWGCCQLLTLWFCSSTSIWGRWGTSSPKVSFPS